MKVTSLQEFQHLFATLADVDVSTLLPSGMEQEAGRFNVFDLAELLEHAPATPAMPYNRRAYYKISLVKGRNRAEYADKVIEIEQNALLFATPRVPYHWLPHDPHQVAHCCVFTADFLLPATSGVVLDDLPIFRPGGYPVLQVSDAAYADLLLIFQKMLLEKSSGYAYKFDLLRTYVLELIHAGQKAQPLPAQPPTPNAAARVTSLFVELLERQFPIETPQQPLRLRTPADFADQLAIHVNHLNKMLRESTGRTTTDLIGSRVLQEAKVLLKQTDWNISEISDGLGFAEVSNFSHFFKRQTALSPAAFRA